MMEKDGDQKKETFSPTKYIAELGHLRTERIIKKAEVHTRKFCYESFKAVHDG